MTLGVLLVVPFALAAPSAADITAGTAESYTYTPTTTTTSVNGGEVQEVNVSGSVVTSKWVGFYGQVSGSILLGDSSGNVFYQWTVSDPTGAVVYAANGSVSTWDTTNIQPLYASDAGWLPSFMLSGADSFNTTFVNQETFTSNSLTINSVNYTTTWQGGSQGTDFKTYALKAVNDNAIIWAGKAVADKTAFNGNTADYQILAGVNSLSGTTTYYFYLELP